MIVATDVLIIGSGIAGSIAALECAKKGLRVHLISSSSPLKTNSYLAQGGIATIGKEDTRELFFSDIEKAGKGLSDQKAIKQLLAHGPSYIQNILVDDLGIPFSTDRRGQHIFTKEAAHSRSRVLFHGDHTGRAIMEALFKRLKNTPSIIYQFDAIAVDLILSSGRCQGATFYNPQTQTLENIFAAETILATGGVGELFLHTTNSVESRGDGIALACRAGVHMRNMEYIQFHPTAFYDKEHSHFLISEAVRGEGGRLLTYDCRPFMHHHHQDGDLAPRDIVAYHICQEMRKSNKPHLWLDISFQDSNKLKKRFPSIYATCLEKGYDITKEPIPIVPAAHYLCGGIAVDLSGKTNLTDLRAIGEVAHTGVHGANRLASTSLLEGLVFGKNVTKSIQLNTTTKDHFPPPIKSYLKETINSHAIWHTIKKSLWNDVGLIRNKVGLQRALNTLESLQSQIEKRPHLSPAYFHARNGVQTALLITQSALNNPTSIGCHNRQDSF